MERRHRWAGRVRADTDVPPADLPTVENHGTRPEVVAALAGGVGEAKRRSATVRSDLLYVAVSGGPGVIRLAMPLDQVDLLVQRSQRSVLVAALLALLMGIPLAYLAGRSIARPLTQTAEAARTIYYGFTAALRTTFNAAVNPASQTWTLQSQP